MPEAKFTPLEFLRIWGGEVSQILLPSIDTFMRWPAVRARERFRKAAAGGTQPLKPIEFVFEPVRQIRRRDRKRINALHAGRPLKLQNPPPGIRKRRKPKPPAGGENGSKRLKVLTAGREQAREVTGGILRYQKNTGGE